MILTLRLFAVMLERGAPAYGKLYFKVELIQVQLRHFMLKLCVSQFLSGNFSSESKRPVNWVCIILFYSAWYIFITE